MKMKVTHSVAALLLVLATACGGEHPVPAHGKVTDAKFTPAWVQVIPGTTICSGNPPSCIMSPTQIIPWPDEWRLEITDLDDKAWVGTVEVQHDVYDRCPVNDLWPECWGGDPR
jgi:hypothetical protein